MLLEMSSISSGNELIDLVAYKYWWSTSGLRHSGEPMEGNLCSTFDVTYYASGTNSVHGESLGLQKL